MTPVWVLWGIGLGGVMLGVLVASACWWWASPKALLTRWSAPLRDALDAGFAEHALQQRLRLQGDKLWARKQQNLLCESQELVHARHHASLMAEIRRLVRSGHREAGAALTASPPPKPASAVPAAIPAEMQDWTDAQVDALPPELPPPPGPRNRNAAGKSPLRPL